MMKKLTPGTPKKKNSYSNRTLKRSPNINFNYINYNMTLYLGYLKYTKVRKLAQNNSNKMQKITVELPKIDKRKYNYKKRAKFFMQTESEPLKSLVDSTSKKLEY